jgi:hypothetical protein
VIPPAIHRTQFSAPASVHAQKLGLTLTVCNFVTGHFDCEKFKKVNVEQFRTMEENTKSVLCILVGFYVSIQIGRWWSQTSKMPKLNKLAMELNAIMQIGKYLNSIVL